MRVFHRAALALLLLLPPAAGAAAPNSQLAAELVRNAALPRAPLLPLEAFDREGEIREVRLAPDGAYLAYIVESRGIAYLYAQPVANGPARRLLGLETGARIHWSGDGSLLFVEQKDGLSAVAPKDGASARLAVFEKAPGSSRSQEFAGIDPSRPRHAIVREDDPARGNSRLLRIGPDGAREVLYDGPGMVTGHAMGADGRLAVIRRLDAQFHQLILRRDGAAWVEATRCLPFRDCSLVALSPDARRLFLKTPHQDDREALVEVTLATGARRTVQQDPLATADLAGVLLSAPTRQPSVAVWLLPQPRMAGIDAAGRRLVEDVARRFPEGGALADYCAPAVCLLAERGARLQGARYWLYDVQARSFRLVLDKVDTGAKPLPERQLARKIALRYTASDGATVHGYLSLPPGLPARSLPLVTAVHGGPWSHSQGGFDPSVQLLVNRGYAVFQPNFRGSTGYGQRYMLAPGADFGNGRVQGDIVDGVRWLLAQGVGDPQRLAIMGGSFGGYSTLLALSHTPGMFRAGIATQPPTDLARALRQAAAVRAKPGEAPFSQVLRELGIDAGNAAQLGPIARAAPALHTASVKVPLLVVAGGRDEKVEVEAVVDYVARLQGLGKPVSLLVDPDEGHNTRNPIVRRAVQHLVLQMLHRHLGGPPAGAPDAEVARYLERTMRADGALPRKGG
ncbi:MAG: prolyl oligopeptidase family serine peptidase [Pseudomonadota bacterium]